MFFYYLNCKLKKLQNQFNKKNKFRIVFFCCVFFFVVVAVGFFFIYLFVCFVYWDTFSKVLLIVLDLLISFIKN